MNLLGWWVATVLGLLLAGVALYLYRLRRAYAEERNAIERNNRFRDEQARQTAAQQLAEQQTLFNSMVEGLLVLGPDHRVKHANAALEQLFGLTTDIRGQTVLEAFRLHQLQEVVNRAIVEGRALGHELTLPGTTGQCLQVNAAKIVDTSGRLLGTIVVFHDLTQLKRLEKARRDFVANVSHELRTPLSLIKGYVETLLDGAHQDPGVATKFLQIILKHADRLTYLIEDLLTLSQLESGQVAINYQAEELHPMVQRALDDFLPRAQEKQVTLVNEVEPGVLVLVDADRLQQVFSNLIDNALKYGPEGNRVTIGTAPVSQDSVTVWIRDRGPGIPPDSVHRVFERFYRVDRGRSREQGGTGLGLAIVKHIVQAHGGDVCVESVLGQGSTFYFTLRRPSETTAPSAS